MRSWWRRIRLVFSILFAACVIGGVLLVADGWVAFGKAASGERRASMEASDQWVDGGFENPQPLWNDVWGSITAAANMSPFAAPVGPLDVVTGDGSRFVYPPADGLRVTWLGHSTTLIEIDGVRVLTDPIWGERASPFEWAGPKRWYEPPIALDDLPAIDAVLISHDHYDHLNQPTIEAIKDWDTTFIVPLGVGAHLAYWGVPEERIVDVDWWDEVTVAGEGGTITVAATPARHASGRHVFDQGHTLWAGFALVGSGHRVFFSGDTGLFPGMTEIGERLGPFDLTMIEVGAYHQAWPDWHIGPEQAIRAHNMLQGKVFLPIHWGMWNLAMHGWTEPAERVLAAAREADTTLVMPRPGESVSPGAPAPVTRWWPEVPWETAAEHPIISRGVD